MTDADKPLFNASFNRLAKSGLIHDDDAVAKAIYFDTLSDLPIWAVERAELRLRREPVKFFTSAIWHEAARSILIEQRRRDAVALATKRLQPEHCGQCRDSGMRPTLLDPDRLERCPCCESNPNYQATRAREELSAQAHADYPSKDEAQQMTDRISDFKRLGSGDR